MPQGLQIFNSSGELWLDISDMTTRVVGTIIAQSGYSTSDPIGSSGYTRDYPCPPNTTPWAYCFPTNGSNGVGYSNRKDSTTATLTYVLPSSWPTGAKVNIIYGYC